MSAGVKKPPLAPKPKLPSSSRPSPPPIAPKPGLPPQTAAAAAQPSPATLKREKPAVAPKPSIPKSSSAPVLPVSPPPPRPPQPEEQQEASDDGVSLLNSTNGILSEAGGPDADYFIPTCSCVGDGRCQPLENGNAGENGVHVGESGVHEEPEQNGALAEGRGEPREESGAVDQGESARISKKPRDKPQRQRHLERAAANPEAQRTEERPENASEPDGRQECSAEQPAAPESTVRFPDPTARLPATDVAGSIIVFSSTALDQEVAAAGRLHPDLQVPAAPCKPLPVPQPRRLKKPALVRQDGVEATAEACEKPSPPGDSDPGDIPVPPPRQTSLSPRLHRTAPPLSKSSSHSDLLGKEGEEERVEERQAEEDEDGGYGDFKRYPITHSLPKQMKLGCQPPPRKALSSEDQPSPRAPPRKPQRHSLPAPPPPSVCPPAPPHANTPMRALPAPPQEKSAWRFTRPCVTFFSRQVPTRSSVPPKGRAPALGGKQRAQSFSAADLATRAGAQKRSLSFRKLLELRLSVKMLPKLLAKGGQSLDCTSVESHGGGRSLERPSSCIGEGDFCVEGVDGSVEYENVPLYEEIPEYMNLPFHGGRPGWTLDSPDADIYEVQDPFQRCADHEYESGWLSQDVHSEEDEEIHSSDDEDNSSTSSKEQLDEADRQQEDEMKRKKVVHIAQEIMSSEKVFVDVLKLLHIDFRDAVAKATRQNGKPVVEERTLSQILYYLPQLYQLNRDLLRELEDRVAHWSDHQRLSDIFVQKGPYLKMYSTYIRQFDNNVALLDEQCRKNPAFAAVVREFEMSPRCASLALKHYLLKPVQRIPQYQLLLTDYLKNLPEDSEDYKDTQAALGIVKEVANHANDIMKQGDNFQKLMQIQYSLNGQHEIVQPGRVFLKEGTLMKLSRKVMQPRMFFLFNDALMYTTPVQSAQYKLNSVLSLAGMKVSKPSQEAYQNELNIESVERSFILSASSATERDEWLEAIARAIDDYTKKKISFISSRSQEEASDGAVDSGAPLGSKAPIWIPDLRATMCMICTCEFTLTWRRHHCRACGKVVCQACSTNKYYLEYLKNQPARVCDHCFAKLQENSDRCASSSVSPIKSGAFSFTRKQKKIPAALKEVSANTENSSMSGYLNRSKGNKKQWKRLWFVIKNKVLYTYAASEDVAALESQPLLGFFLREEKNGPAQKLQFKLYHKNTLFYIFKADDIPTAQRWIEAFQEAMILEQ
ncbi:FYVE, RhoGEF and PH domain-containing protein 6-like [Salarias fasciatus]|uniref:FYVE, RhoGEF and PH domain-containing protein 6-like n=1 Tax=Salarias fasciatus TaxID=181472 RepID=A0A672GHZ9_SALFA|nr:FYVE, RhoGEF and PH domain-containing protein 6-like [Salarias fasciatus]